ncbi:MAG TPA: hypothetical protein VL285_09360 [Bryobacteraceae bacterium]|jgi:hypothetical protein|nr:hypothetical protein [Bryobacteraceae bacterium]
MIKYRTGAIVKSLLLLLLTAGAAPGQQEGGLERRVDELERKIRLLEPDFAAAAQRDLGQRVAALEAKINELLATRTVLAPEPPSPAPAPEPLALQPLANASVQTSEPAPEQRLPVSGYMDFHFNKERTQPGQLDFHRFVLLFGHSFSPRIKFWSELEVEHALVEGGEEKGELELEQAYLDFLVKPYFNLRAGMLLTPMGILNERHEPPAFNGVERTFVETVIIPSTWFDAGFGATGEFGGGFRYRAYMMAGLDAAGFDAGEGFRNGRQGGFQSSFRNPAQAARIEYAGVRRLTLGLSGYTGQTGFNLRNVNPRASILSFDGRYSAGSLDFRGLYARTWLSHARELNLALQSDRGGFPNIARQMQGAYFEPAVHILPRRFRQDGILFARYENFNTQRRMPQGFLPLPQFDRSAWVIGAGYKPNADIALKFDYSFNRNASSVVRARDSINVGIGWWF